MRLPTLSAPAITVAVMTLFGTSPAAAQGVLADFLNFPWGLTELSDGSILVAESGGSKISRHYTDGTSEDFATDLFDVRDVAPLPSSAELGILYAQTLEDEVGLLDLEGNPLVPEVEFPAPIAFAQDEENERVFIGGFSGQISQAEVDEQFDFALIGAYDQVAGLDYEANFPIGGGRGGGSLLAVQSSSGQILRVFLDGSTEVFATVDASLNGGIAALGDGSVLVTVDGGVSFDPGRVVRIYPDGTQEDFATDLNFPRGLLVRSDGHVLVTNYNSGPLGALLDLGVVPVDSESGATPVAGLTVSEPRPNPTGDLLRVQVETDTPSRVRAEVYDVLGRRVASSFDAVVAESAEIEVDASALAPGLYILRVIGAQAAETRRFTVVR